MSWLLKLEMCALGKESQGPYNELAPDAQHELQLALFSHSPGSHVADTSALRIPHAATQLPAACCRVSTAQGCLVASKVTLVTPDVSAQCSLKLGAIPFC